jgi:hypothetical protein
MKMPPIALIACLIPLSAAAALPPQYQRAEELGRIITDRAVQSALKDQPINSITMTAQDVFEVASDDCTVIATLFDLPAPGDGWVGPRQFDLTVGEADCR